MKIAITGHTNGIGKAIYDDLITTNDVIGFSLTTGYDISSPEERKKIIEESMDCTVFINNAFDYSKWPTEENTDSQCLMAEELFDAWKGQEKFIINIGSRINDFSEFENEYKAIYAKQKKRLDQFYLDHSHEKPYVITVRPGSTNTRVVKQENIEKLNPKDVAQVIRFILENKYNFLVRTITLGKIND
ncbi:MAG: hypothetical protein EBU66_07445 [Bacteroidetes bacterium]|nr:hypothetical protein [bacterium]NBP64479.1 hypothetical protein [Bacteroidota bacterium]